MKLPALLFLISLFFCFSGNITGQVTIYLENPSFEDIPRAGSGATPPIKGWWDCGLSRFPGETPPDIHPVSTNAWAVSKEAIDGDTYLGLVVRDNNTWESVSQPLETELQASKCYSLDAMICHAEKYQSRTKRSPDKLEDFTNPVVLNIWGGKYFCDKRQLLAKSELIENYDWQLYTFNFQPQENWKYITFEAFYKTIADESYNGHLLLDDLSPIIEIECLK